MSDQPSQALSCAANTMPSTCKPNQSSNSTSPPQRNQESLIHSACPILAPTGCTPQFCVAGRMIRPLDPRVGENRPIEVIKQEAEAFLKEMLAEGLFDSSEVFEQRLMEVIKQIEENSGKCMVWEDSAGDDGVQRRKVQGVSSNGYVQTKEELEWGVRVAWRNSRKCIMRAHCWDLKCLDLRDIKTSKGMLDAIIKHCPTAYNRGRIAPTVFIFPGRHVDCSGPMFWSQQFLNFAGYELSPGEVLGDPAQVQLTKDIIALGWQPPTPKTRWDILPLVAMAEGEEPEFATLPPELTQLVSIAHPQYPKIADLDLRWGKFPALSRLGFDIGGVQYTASPFIGWFMDAEIGVRNLADTFRYNVLPEVAKTIGWSSPSHTFGELPDHERLLWLSRAQAELNYAVYCSFQKAGVTCTSSLTASHSWTTFDDQHLREKGYRLNADPYWISPPQGSVVPLWHRGGAPNYQPKPLIARHRCDPVQVWKRRYNAPTRVKGQLGNADYDEDRPAGSQSKVHIFYCGTNGTAAKLAERLRIFMAKKSSKIVREFGTLNSFDPCKIYPGGTALFIVSTTGTGEIPSNGQQFLKKMNVELAFPLLKFSMLGIGDSGYHGTFNGACKSVQRILKEKQLKPLMLDCVTESDVSVENPPWTDFRVWCSRIERALDGETEEGSLEPAKTDHIDNLYEKQYSTLKAYKKATMRFDPFIHRPGEILKLSLEISESDYEPMGHIRLLPRNSEVAAQRAMTLLEINDNQTIGTVAKENPAYPSQIQDQRQVQLLAVPIRQFLTDFVDLHSPFLSMDWAQNLSNVKNGPALQVLEHLSRSLQHLSPSISPMELLLSLTTLRPRSYSIASSSEHTVDSDMNAVGTTLGVFVRIIPNGRFSHHCLSEVGNGGKILYKLTPNNICTPLLKLNGKPLVAVACGTGIAPVRSLLQHLIHTNNTESKISIFIGFRPDDSSTDLFIEIVEQALEKGILDILDIVPSNKEKLRVQDHFGDCKEALRRKLGEEAGYFYVCGNAVVVREAKDRLKGVLGPEIWTRVQERILEETF